MDTRESFLDITRCLCCVVGFEKWWATKSRVVGKQNIYEILPLSSTYRDKSQLIVLASGAWHKPGTP